MKQYLTTIVVMFMAVGAMGQNRQPTTGDATKALRSAVGLAQHKRIYDYNGDGKVTAQDALNILRMAKGQPVSEPMAARLTWKRVPTAEDALHALRISSRKASYHPHYDFNGDGKVTAADALNILRMSKGLEPSARPASQVPFIYAQRVPTMQDVQTALRISVGLDKDKSGIYDFDGNGKVTASDALQLLRFSVGLNATTKMGTNLPWKKK